MNLSESWGFPPTRRAKVHRRQDVDDEEREAHLLPQLLGQRGAIIGHAAVRHKAAEQGEHRVGHRRKLLGGDGWIPGTT